MNWWTMTCVVSNCTANDSIARKHLDLQEARVDLSKLRLIFVTTPIGRRN